MYTGIPHIDFAEESCDVRDVPLQKLIQAHHVCLLRKENIVGQILHDLSDDHEASTDHSVIFGYLNIDYFRSDDSRRNETEVEMNNFSRVRLDRTNRRNIKAPRAANFDSGQT